MSDYLVIVESPSKSKTIEKFLGNKYNVMSSVGHIRDLSTSGPGGLGVDIENGFKPDYKLIRGKGTIVQELKTAAKKATHVYLATDPDREGEAISWHLYDTLGLDDAKTSRVLFNEITKNAILKAFGHTRDIDINLVRSQESRRILDRIIGFKLSALLKSKIKSKSAGRVQSAALRLIVDKEEEIQAFIPEEYWEIEAEFNIEGNKINAKLVKFDNKKIQLKCEEDVNNVLKDIKQTSFIVQSIDEKKKSKKSNPPYITSTLQQDAANKLGFNASKTMRIAQKLYEGIQLKTGRVGLITYMRTDSVRFSDEFVQIANDYIANNFGKEYVKGFYTKTKSNGNIQDAHEAIRPTDVNVTPESIKDILHKDEYKLYHLIYIRALASLMKNATISETVVEIVNNQYIFRINGNRLLFDGYLKLYQKEEGYYDKLLPNVSKNQALECININKEQLFTNPPLRYTEARLIKKMEELGIGRPSTYAQTMEILKKRDYITITDKKFIPTEQGKLTTEKLIEFFPKIVDAKYTANVETVLDEIADGKRDWQYVLGVFYKRFVPQLKEAQEKMEKLPPKETGEVCPKCGSPLVYRTGRYGEFVACSSYPKCKYIKNDKEEPKKVEGVICPECKTGHIVERVSKRGKNKGKTFYACDNYPKCKFTSSVLPIGNCEECGSLLVEVDGKPVCQNDKCVINTKK